VVTSDEKQIHINACREFLRAIDNGEYPDNANVQYHNVLRQYPQSEGTTAELPESARDLLDLLKATRNQIKEQTALEEDLKTELCLMLGESEYGSLNGSVVCTWKTSTRSSLDSKRFETEHPALYAKFKKQSTYRTFTIKGAK
jgi:predicted phage-related endonuclease